MLSDLCCVEFHCHTHASKDSLTLPADLIAAARSKGIDRVVVTDHNSIAGAREAQAIDPELIIIGEEIMTTKGEILAAFVQEEISRVSYAAGDDQAIKGTRCVYQRFASV